MPESRSAAGHALPLWPFRSHASSRDVCAVVSCRRQARVHKGGPAKITGAMQDDASPMRGKCQTLRTANDQIIAQLGDDLRPGVDSRQIARLARGRRYRDRCFPRCLHWPMSKLGSVVR